MKKIALLLASLCLVSSASAADMGLKAPASTRAPAGIDWTGFYMGLDGGYAWTRDRFDSPITDVKHIIGSLQPVGAVLGGHVGFRTQVGAWLPGVEVDFTWLSRTANKLLLEAGVETPAVNMNASIKYLASVRGTLGVLVAPSWQLYVTAGPGLGSTESAITSGDLVAQSATGHFGYVVGGGTEVELGMGSRVFLRAQFLHYDFGKTTASFSTPVVGTNIQSRLTADVATLGLSFKF